MANRGNGRSRTHTDVELFGRKFRDTGVVAGDLEEVRQKPFEPVQFGDKQFRRPTQHGVEVLAAVVDQVGGHPDRGQWCAQFMADIGGEAFLEAAELLQLGDLLGQTLGHLVEGHGQARHVVLAADRHSFLESAVCETHCDSRGRSDGKHDLSGNQQRNRRQEHQQHGSTDQQGASNKRQTSVFAGEREDQIQLESRYRRRGGATDDQRGSGVTVRVGHRRELVTDLAAFDELAKVVGDLIDRSRTRRLARPVPRHDEHRVEGAG